MAYTEIHKITATLYAALDYITKDKEEDLSEEKIERINILEGNEHGKSLEDTLRDSLDYAYRDKENTLLFKTYTSYNSCFPIEGESFGKYIISHSDFWSKEKENDKNRKVTRDNKEVVAWHMIQSFEESIRPEVANEIGRKLVEEIIPDYPCQISTHTNTGHTHNHIIFSAWDMDGKKFHNDHKAVDLVRRISDKLCNEYGLHVLEDTKEMKLVKYKDSDGNIHFYEPTDRKNEIINQRNKVSASKDDVNSYRNTYKFEEKKEKRESIRSIVKQDIDYWIPQVSSFTSLLQRLREQGYKIKEKKKNGEWLSYITYKPPVADRGVRDSSLSEDGYYLRTNLEKVIEELNRRRETPEQIDKGTINSNLRYFDKYVVGEFDPFTDIDEHTRIDHDDNRGFYAKRRSIVETEVIKDLRKEYKNIESKYHSGFLKELSKQHGAIPNEKELLLESIRFKCDCLRFIENKDIKTFDAIQNRINKTSDQINKMNDAVDALRTAIGKEKRLVSLPGEIEKISYKIAANKNNEGYMATEYASDVKTINRYKKILQEKGLVTPERIRSFEKRVSLSEKKLKTFEERAEYLNSEMAEYYKFNDYVKAIGFNYEKEREEQGRDEKSKQIRNRIL